MYCQKNPVVAIALLLWFATADPIQGAPDRSTLYETGKLSLACQEQQSAETHDLKIACSLRNEDSRGFVILTGSPILEGPYPGEDYFYPFTGGERFENILQYIQQKVGTLDHGVLFKPSAHLSHQDMGLLIRIGPGETLSITVQWPSGKMILREYGELLTRVKIMVVPGEVLSALLEGGELDAECKKLVHVNDAARDPQNLALECKRASKGVRYRYDGCRDVLSESFRHLFSNSFTIEVHD